MSMSIGDNLFLFFFLRVFGFISFTHITITYLLYTYIYKLQIKYQHVIDSKCIPTIKWTENDRNKNHDKKCHMMNWTQDRNFGCYKIVNSWSIRLKPFEMGIDTWHIKQKQSKQIHTHNYKQTYTHNTTQHNSIEYFISVIYRIKLTKRRRRRSREEQKPTGKKGMWTERQVKKFYLRIFCCWGEYKN